MTQQDHLQVFELVLKTRSPVFIGNGKSSTAKEYLFDSRSNTVAFLDEQKFFTCLIQHNLVDAYEDFMVRNAERDLLAFLKKYRITDSEVKNFTLYKVDAADALDESHSLKEIHRFIRGASGQVYVPGSSIKGALRTALLKAILLKNPPKNPSEDLIWERNPSFEADYFHTLSLKKDSRNPQLVDKKNPLNSILQGVRISDSQPISDKNLCITRKVDEFSDDSYNSINVCRECIRPGTVIVGTITLDQSILQGKLTVGSIQNAIAAASQHYETTVVRHYPQAANYMNSNTILLGGGVGFQSKTVIDPYYGKSSVSITAKILQDKFSMHQHKKDIAEGISPRALKQTGFQNAPYPYGVCEVTIR